MQRIVVSFVAFLLSAGLGVGCGGSEASVSEVATSTVSGALNNTSGTLVGMNDPALRLKKSPGQRFFDALNPVGTAYAASWSCQGGTLSPTYSGPGADPYAYTPVSCSVSWGNGKTASSKWSGTFGLNYGASCDSTHAWIGRQVANCSVTRSTAAGGNTRTITGPEGNQYAITHDTNGAGTGWDTTVTPAPTNDGVVATCTADTANVCSAGTLAINGSHLTGTLTPAGGSASKWWDHTVTTGASPITITRNATSVTVNGAVTVQHNLAKYTATATFNDVVYSDALCCFPTSGSVSVSFANGPEAGKSEQLTFTGGSCGEATITQTSGRSTSLTLQHCI